MTFADLQSISLELQKFSKINWHVSESTSTTFLSSLRSHIWSSRLKYITGCSITFSLSEPQCYPHISTPLCRRKLSKVRTEWVCLFLLPLPHLLHAIDIPLPWFSFLVFSFLPEIAKMKHTIFFVFSCLPQLISWFDLPDIIPAGTGFPFVQVLCYLSLLPLPVRVLDSQCFRISSYSCKGFFKCLPT